MIEVEGEDGQPFLLNIESMESVHKQGEGCFIIPKQALSEGGYVVTESYEEIKAMLAIS